MKSLTQIPLSVLVKLEKVVQEDCCREIAGPGVLSRGRKMVCVCVLHMSIHVFKGVVHLSACMWGISSEMNYRDHLSPLPSSLLQANHFTLLPKHHESGMYVSAAKRSFHCIFRHFLKNKGCFVGARFAVSASVIPIRLPSVPAYGSPSAKPQEMRYSYHPRGV